MADTEARNVEDADFVMQEDTLAADGDVSSELSEEEHEEYVDVEMEDTETVAEAVDPDKVKPKEEPEPSPFDTYPVTVRYQGQTHRIQLSMEAWWKYVDLTMTPCPRIWIYSFKAYLQTKGHEAGTIEAVMEHIEEAVAKIDAQVNPVDDIDEITIPYGPTSRKARGPRKITMSRELATEFRFIMQERFHDDDFEEDETAQFTAKLQKNRKLTKKLEKSIDSFVEWLVTLRIPSMLNDGRILNVSQQALKSAGWSSSSVETAGQQEDPAQPSEKNHDPEPISITVQSEVDPNKTYTTKCPFELASLYQSILTETHPTDKDLYHKCANAIIDDDDTLIKGAKESMLRWLEAHQREGAKGLPAQPPATTVAATEHTPVLNNPLAPAPFEPINPAELLAYEEPTLSENESDTLFRAHQMGSAVMWVRELNPQWQVARVSQRPLIDSHVTRLARNMRVHGIRRLNDKDRLLASVMPEDLAQSIEYTSRMTVQWKSQGVMKRSYTPQELRDTYKWCANTQLSKITNAPPLLWDPKLERQPQLDRGQHRREALLRIHANLPYGHLSPGNYETATWVVDFANMSELDDRYYALTRANCVDEYLPDSEGDVFMQLLEYYDDWLSEEARLTPTAKKAKKVDERFEHYVNRMRGGETKNVKRYLTLLGNKTWRSMAQDWCKYAFGRFSFRSHHFAEGPGLMMDECWLAIFKGALRRVDDALGMHGKRVSGEDLNWMASLGKPLAHTEDLRQLFFPCPEDVDSSSDWPVRLEWFDQRAEYKQYQVELYLTLGGFPKRYYTFRRPGFLQNFSNREYGEIAEHLSQQANRVPTSKEAIEHVTGAGKILQAVVRHVIWWVSPTWIVPANADSTFHTTDMVRVVRNAYQERVGLGDGPDEDSLFADADALAQNQKAGSVMVKKTNRWLGLLLDYIREEKASFSILLRNKQLSLDPALVGTAVPQDARRHYRNNFYLKPWQKVLALTMLHLGHAQFTGVMKYFHLNPDAIKQAPSSLDRLELSVHEFQSKHTDVRMSHLAVNKSPYFHQDRVEASIQQAILTEELRTALMIVADAVKVQRELAEYRALTTNAVTYDGLPDQDDEEKGMGIMRVGESPEDARHLAENIIRTRVALLADFGITLVYKDNPTALLASLGKPPGYDPVNKLEAIDSEYEAPVSFNTTPSRGARSTKNTKRARDLDDRIASDMVPPTTPSKPKRSKRR